MSGAALSEDAMQPFMAGDPEQIAEEMNRRAELANAAFEDKMHQRDKLFQEDLTRDQLLIMGELLSFLATSEDPAANTRYYHGMVNTVLNMKFGICPGCGTKHEDPDEFLKRAAEQEAASTPVTVVDPPADYDENDFEAEMIQYNLTDSGEMVNDDDLLAKYNMERRGLGLHCRGCGVKYPSLEDRMLKGPDDCHHCHERAKHG